MSKVLVLYYSSYGHVEKMAQAEADGARSIPGTQVDIKRVPELVPDDLARSSGYKLDQAAPVARIDDLAAYDAIIVGCGTRFGRMASQMASFLDQAGGLWARGVLNGKVGAAFTSTATQHGGQEATLFSILTNLLHFGMVTVGLPYSFAGQMTLDEITGGSPYGATTIAGGQGQRQPSENELAGAYFQGRLVAETAARLAGELKDIKTPMPQGEAHTWKEPDAGSDGPAPAH
ncbi:MAG: NAD(P)H:quinone oxidoreductase [Alphaproteobacteria bacterium]|nr:NAD(P)H:quinone oxidoreductase [Alphaproteobacteria bacterium]